MNDFGMYPSNTDAAQHGGPADDGCDPDIEDDEDAGPELEDRLDNALVAAGLMARFPPSALTGGDDCFTVTAAGRLVARGKTPEEADPV